MGLFKSLWKLKVAPTTQHQGWRVLLDRIHTKANLINRGIQVSNARCVFCDENDETA